MPSASAPCGRVGSMSSTTSRETLTRFLEDRGVTTDGVVERLEAYEALVRRWNTRWNLVSRHDMDRLRARHVEDSLELLPWCRGRLADVGSGAGFPGVPLAIARPGSAVVLIERSERKARFLEQVVIELGLANVEVIAQDVGELLRSGRAPAERFDTVTARAVAPPAEAWKLVRNLLLADGQALLQSGTRLSPGMFEGGEIRRAQRGGGSWITAVALAP